ncbi:DUF4333 domain-containing protein [Streptomyces sp. NPDC054796]
MKPVVIALAVAAVLAVGTVGAYRLLDNVSVATATGTGGGNSNSNGTDRMVPRAEVEKQAEENFARPFFEEAPKSVSCPRGLRAKKLDTVRCTAVFGDGSKPMLISVTGVRGDKVSFDYGVEETSHDGGTGKSE